MTPQHAHSSGGGSAGRAIVLVVVAVALGALLLARGFGGADDSSADAPPDDSESESPSTGDGPSEDPEDGGTTSSTTSTTTTTTAPPVVTHPPGEVKVAVMNGTGERGRAGRTAEPLNAGGYVTAAKNTEQDRVDRSVIYYKEGYGDDAKAVASVLGAPPDIITPAPGTILTLIRNPETPENLQDFNVFAVVGADDVILDPSPPAG